MARPWLHKIASRVASLVPGGFGRRRDDGDYRDNRDYRRLFEAGINNAGNTNAYLRSPESDLISATIRSRHDREVSTLRQMLTSRVAAPAGRVPFKIALTNHALTKRFGSELWTHDVALFLARNGADVLVYSPELGPVARAMSSAGIAVTAWPARVSAFAPDLLHVNHYSAARDLVATLQARGTRIVNMCHGLLPRAEWPQPAGADRYCAVSAVSKAVVWLLADTDWKSIPIIPNFFDERRFRGRTMSGGGSKAVLFSNRATVDHVVLLRAALARCGYSLDVVGQESRIDNAEDVLPQYDLALAVGRSAIEALASGCRVVLWDHGVLGPLVTEENFWHCVCVNFALASKQLPYCLIDKTEPGSWLATELAGIGNDSSNAPSRMTRQYLALDNVGAHLREMYRAVLAAADNTSFAARDGATAPPE